MTLAALDPAHQRVVLAMPYSHAAMLLMVTAFLVGIFYSLDALHGERRDRSILFWKSLPVSDLTTVLSKASIPLVVLPLLVFAITVALQLIMLLLSTAVLLVSGVSAATLWTRLPLFQMELVLALRSDRACALACAHLRLAAAGLRLGAARDISMGRVAAAASLLASFEKIAFHTSYFGSLLQNRLFGFAAGAFDLKDKVASRSIRILFR